MADAETTPAAAGSSAPPESTLIKFLAALPEILKDADHDEMYGVKLTAPSEGTAAPTPTQVILQKFLRANTGDLAKAREQLTNALKWRKEYQPLKVKDEVFDSKFGGLGYIIKTKSLTDATREEIVAFNVYGEAAKDPKRIFGDTDAFIRWRVALMELTLAELKLSEVTVPVPEYGQGPDPYTAINVHDYLSVSFFRQPAEIKASSSRLIDMFQRYYPETVSFKYFVNVPIIMQWMMGAMKALMSKDSIQKMTWLTYGSELHKYLGEDIPQEYGGKGPALASSAITPKYATSETAALETKPAGEVTTDDVAPTPAAAA